MTKFKLLVVLLLLIAAQHAGGGGIGAEVDRVTYVYEKDNTAIPRPVDGALSQLNKQGKMLASEFERNTTNGTGETPEQNKIALQAGIENGLPCLVVQAGEKVVRVVKNPTTAEQVLEAAK